MYIFVLVKIHEPFQNGGRDHRNQIFRKCHIGAHHNITDTASTAIFHHNLFNLGMQGQNPLSEVNLGMQGQNPLSEGGGRNMTIQRSNPNIIVVLIAAVVTCDIFAVTFLQNFNLVHQFVQLFLHWDNFDRPELMA